MKVLLTSPRSTASVDADGRRGAWGDTQALILRPRPRAPLGRVNSDGSAIELAWSGRVEDRAEVEMACDPAFQQIVARGDFGDPGGRGGTLARPPSGTYHVRYRFVEADGLRTAWSAAARIEVDRSWRKSLRALFAR